MPFYHDDGTEIDPNNLIIPEKCLQCKSYTVNNLSVDLPDALSTEWEENVLCVLNRIDHMNKKEFECMAFIFNPDWKNRIS